MARRTATWLLIALLAGCVDPSPRPVWTRLWDCPSVEGTWSPTDTGMRKDGNFVINVANASGADFSVEVARGERASKELRLQACAADGRRWIGLAAEAQGSRLKIGLPEGIWLEAGETEATFTMVIDVPSDHPVGRWSVVPRVEPRPDARANYHGVTVSVV